MAVVKFRTDHSCPLCDADNETSLDFLDKSAAATVAAETV